MVISAAIEYYPDLEKLVKRLHTISPKIAFQFQLMLIEFKHFEKRHKIAKEQEELFFYKHFGDRKEVREFAKKLILHNRKDIALEVNRAIKVLGRKADAELIINRIKGKYIFNFKFNHYYSSN